jgi:hypothetical protein
MTDNVIEFKLKSYKVLFRLPKDNKIIMFRKNKDDNFEILLDGDYGTAHIKTTTKKSAEKKVLKMFPNSIIVQVITLK